MDELYDPVGTSELMGSTGHYHGLGCVDVKGTNPVPDSFCNPRVGGCGKLGCMKIAVTRRPQLLFVWCEQFKRDGASLKVPRYVNVYPNSQGYSVYTLAAVVLHEVTGHYVGLACLPKDKFKFMNGFGEVRNMGNVVTIRYIDGDKNAQVFAPLNYNPTMFVYTHPEHKGYMGPRSNMIH